jgi:hypothetical protein
MRQWSIGKIFRELTVKISFFVTIRGIVTILLFMNALIFWIFTAWRGVLKRVSYLLHPTPECKNISEYLRALSLLSV